MPHPQIAIVSALMFISNVVEMMLLCVRFLCIALHP